MGPGVCTDLQNAGDALEHALAADLFGLSDDALHDALFAADRVRRLAEAATVRVVAEVDVRRSFEPLGAKTAAAFVAWKLPSSIEAARSRVRCSRQLRNMDLVREAFYAGAISDEHVRLLARCEHTNRDEFLIGEATLVAQAIDLDFQAFSIIVRYWCQAADPDGSEADAAKAYLDRAGHVIASPDGMTLIRGQLAGLDGSVFATTFELIKRELFEQDWNSAKTLHGDSVSLSHLERTDAQRGADALLVMAQRARLVNATDAQNHPVRPLVTVLLGEATLANLCQTDTGTVLDPHQLIPWLTIADVERVVFAGKERVIEVGPRHRFFDGALRKAIQVRDRECVHPSCHHPAVDADIDHITPFEHGGETTQDNGRVLCRWHHRWRHRTDQPTG